MISYRPVLVLAAAVVATTACGVSNPGNVPATGGTLGTGGVVASGGSGSGGVSNTGGGVGSGGLPGGTGGGLTTGGAPGSGGSGTGGVTGTGGITAAGEDGPCDIYGAAGNECVAAYSTVRRLLSTYAGPLYQVRSGSSEYNIGGNRVTNPQSTPYNTTPEAGELHDIPQTADGFADAAAQDAACAGTVCSVVKLYDQSGHGNNLTVAKGGRSAGGTYAAFDDFETVADAGPITVGGRNVYSLYMEARQGYRQTTAGDGMALGDAPQGMYILADGTRTGTACCWDFGNVTPDPTAYSEMNTLLFGVAYWGRGAGNGPWFGADFEAGVWMGGSNPGDPGWGGLNDAANAPANSENPSLKVKYALGFLKTTNSPERYALRMADIATATEVHTGYAGNYPSGKALASKGAVVLGVGGDNSNNSWGTFYEGAIVSGFPDDATEQAVLENLKAVGYTP